MHKYIVVVELSKNRDSEYRKLDKILLEKGFEKSLAGKNKDLSALPRGVFAFNSKSSIRLPSLRKTISTLAKEVSDAPQIIVVNYSGGSWELGNS